MDQDGHGQLCVRGGMGVGGASRTLWARAKRRTGDDALMCWRTLKSSLEMMVTLPALPSSSTSTTPAIAVPARVRSRTIHAVRP